MRKLKKTIGAIMAFASILFPLSCDSIMLASIGVVTFFIGCYMAEVFCWQQEGCER